MVAALTWREFAITRSYRLAYVADFLLGGLNLAVFFFISRTFPQGSGAHLQGARTYFGFAAVGLVITIVIQAASIGMARRVREEQLTGTLEALLSHPVSAAELSLGLAGSPFLFAMGRSALYMALVAPWLDLGAAGSDWLGVVLMFLATAGAVTSIGIALGAIVLVIKRSDMLAGMLSFALGVLGGALFPIAVLPSWLRWLAWLDPIRASFDGVRAALFRGHGWAGAALVLIAFTTAALPFALWLFSRALEINRRRGTLSQY